MRVASSLSLLPVLVLGACRQSPDARTPGAPFSLELRSRRSAPDVEDEIAVDRAEWDPRRTAVVLVDLWDHHWCRGAEARVGELAGPIEAFLTECRARGAFIVHAPSSVVDFYEGTPARELAKSAPFHETPFALSTDERWGTNWCWPDPSTEGELPIDDSDMGCDCQPKCELGGPWTRQIATVTIAPGDALSHDGQEVWNLLRERGIEHVLICGVHLNMCVLGRPFGIRQLTALGLDVALVRDLTDTMYNSERRPFVDHFSGTDLVIEHVERRFCPSVLSSDVTGAAPFRFAADRRDG